MPGRFPLDLGLVIKDEPSVHVNVYEAGRGLMAILV